MLSVPELVAAKKKEILPCRSATTFGAALDCESSASVKKISSSFRNENCFPLNHFFKNFLSLICCATVSQFDK